MSNSKKSQTDFIGAHYLLAEKLWENGQFPEALEVCKRIINIDPHNIHAQFMAACIFEMQGAFDRAIVLIENILNDQPDPEHEVRVRANLALDYLELGQYGKAADCCRRALELNPNNFENNNNMAYILNQQKRFKESIPFAQKACRLNPNDAGAFGNLGEACLALEHLKEAVEAFEQSVKLTDPNDIMQVMRKVKLDTARKRLKTNLQKKQKQSLSMSANDFNREGALAAEQGKFEEAYKFFRLAIEAEPRNPIRYHNFAHFLYRQGKLDEAIKNFEKAIEINPTDGQHYVDLSEVWASLDKPKEALENLSYGLILMRREDKITDTIQEVVFGKILEGFFTRLGLRTSEVRDAYLAERKKEIEIKISTFKNKQRNNQ